MEFIDRVGLAVNMCTGLPRALKECFDFYKIYWARIRVHLCQMILKDTAGGASGRELPY